MSEATLAHIFDNGGYFVLLIWIWYIVYVLGKMFIKQHMEYEAERTRSFVKLTDKTIENTTKIVNSLNMQEKNNDNIHHTIIQKIDDTHNDVKIIKKEIENKDFKK